MEAYDKFGWRKAKTKNKTSGRKEYNYDER